MAGLRVAVVGAGGIGGFLGALLIRGGADVVLVARGPHLAAMQSRGLVLESQLFGTWSVRPLATADASSVGRVDLVLFCVKTYDLAAAAYQCRAIVGADTAVIPVQNGIEAAEHLGAILGTEHILGGLTYVAGRLVEPGRVRQRGLARELVFGELEGGHSARAVALAAFLQQHGVPVQLRDDMQRLLWEKFVVICATGGVLAVTRLPFGQVFRSPEATALMRGVMAEVARIAPRRGVPLEAGTEDRLLAFLRSHMADDARSSQLQDLEAGRPLELEFLNGAAVRLGKETGVSTPLNFAIYAALKPHAAGRSPAPGRDGQRAGCPAAPAAADPGRR